MKVSCATIAVTICFSLNSKQNCSSCVNFNHFNLDMKLLKIALNYLKNLHLAELYTCVYLWDVKRYRV